MALTISLPSDAEAELKQRATAQGKGVTEYVEQLIVKQLEAPGTAGSDDFARLADEWERATRNLSSPDRMAAHPAYLRIIGMGFAAVPMILHRMESKPGFWFAALRSITGVDPVQEQDRGDIEAMTRAWLSWGRQHGHSRS